MPPQDGTATVTTGGTHCDTDLAVDSAAGNLLSVNYRAVSVNFAGTSSLVVMPEVVETIGDFNSPSVNGYPFATNPGIQLDPATRTG